jgi:hypothetical protein
MLRAPTSTYGRTWPSAARRPFGEHDCFNPFHLFGQSEKLAHAILRLSKRRINQSKLNDINMVKKSEIECL